jgi:hypothetical protein
MNTYDINQASGDGTARLSAHVEQAVRSIRAIVTEEYGAHEQDARITQILSGLGRDARTRGIAPEALLVAMRTAWQKRVAPVLTPVGEDPDFARLRAIGALLEAYFMEDQ